MITSFTLFFYVTARASFRIETALKLIATDIRNPQAVVMLSLVGSVGGTPTFNPKVVGLNLGRTTMHLSLLKNVLMHYVRAKNDKRKHCGER